MCAVILHLLSCNNCVICLLYLLLIPSTRRSSTWYLECAASTVC